MPHRMSESRKAFLYWLVIFVLGCALIGWAVLESKTAQRSEKSKITDCKEPVFLQAVGHQETTGWIYGCSDGSMIELPQPLPSAPIGTPDGWAGGR
jgi:hypothetical protein